MFVRPKRIEQTKAKNNETHSAFDRCCFTFVPTILEFLNARLLYTQCCVQSVQNQNQKRLFWYACDVVFLDLFLLCFSFCSFHTRFFLFFVVLLLLRLILHLRSLLISSFRVSFEKNEYILFIRIACVHLDKSNNT